MNGLCTPHMLSSAMDKEVYFDLPTARSVGAKWYMGRPCKHGHSAPRLVSNGTCRECAYGRWHKYASEDPERFTKYRSAAQKKFMAANPGYAREQYLKHIEKRRAVSGRWAKANRKGSQAIKRRWKINNRRAVAAWSRKRRAMTLKACPRWLSEDHREQIIGIYLEAKTRSGKWHVDHIVPVNGANVCGLHVPWNLQVIPAAENLAKGNRFDSEAHT